MSIFEEAKEKYESNALDTLSVLYWRGALDSGSIPSKAGLATLIEDNLAQTDWDHEKAHSLTELGKLFAKQYFEAKAALVSEVADRSSITINDVFALMASTAARWMTEDIKSDEFRDKCGDTLEFECVEIENNPAYTRKVYRAVSKIDGLTPQLTLLVGDRTTDVLGKLVYVA